jgi:ferredoxin
LLGKVRVKIDKHACQGFGACVELCPRFFQLSEVDGKSQVHKIQEARTEGDVAAGTLELDDLECVREAAEACPFNAIHIVNMETKEKLI